MKIAILVFVLAIFGYAHAASVMTAQGDIEDASKADANAAASNEDGAVKVEEESLEEDDEDEEMNASVEADDEEEEEEEMNTAVEESKEENAGNSSSSSGMGAIITGPVNAVMGVYYGVTAMISYIRTNGLLKALTDLLYLLLIGGGRGLIRGLIATVRGIGRGLF